MPLMNSVNVDRRTVCIVLLLILIGSGLFFRVVKLDQTVYWVDEVATSIRIAGHTTTEVIHQVADGQVLSPQVLQQYQQLDPTRPFSDTVHALVHSPEHAPLYFVLARVWVQIFGSSIAAIRSFSVVCSAVMFLGIYWLCWELFRSAVVGWVAIGLLSISPVFVAYAQEARPYSLWSVMILCSGAALLRAVRNDHVWAWGLYMLSLIVSFYTSLLSLPVAIGHGIYVIFRTPSALRCASSYRFIKHTPGSVRPVVQTLAQPSVQLYCVAFSGALLTFLPWLGVMFTHWQSLQDNTLWMRSALGILPMLAIWFYSLAVLFFDVPVSVSLTIATAVKVGMASMMIGLLGVSWCWLYRRTPRSIWLFLLTLTVTEPCTLVLVDLVNRGQLSTAPRYLMPCYVGLLIAIAYMLADRLGSASPRRRRITQAMLALIVISSLISCLAQLQQPPKYQKSRNLSNQPIATALNQADSPLVLAEPQETIDLISLSNMLSSDVKLRILPASQLLKAMNQCANFFLFNPSPHMQSLIRQTDHVTLTEVYQPHPLIPSEIVLSLWHASVSNCREENQP